MKVAVAGKGGVGKTIISAVLSRTLARDGFDVLAVDVDPSLNLASSMGIAGEIALRIKPLSEEIELIESRVKTSFGPVLNLTPRVDDIIGRYSVPAPDGVRLISLGTVRTGGEGCQCSENAFLRAIMAQLVLGQKGFVIMDMGAGLEHLGRGTAKGVDLMLCVVEPTIKSFDTASRVIELSGDLGISRVWGVVNKYIEERDGAFVRSKADEIRLDVAGLIPYDASIVEAERAGISPMDHNPGGEAMRAMKTLSRKLIGLCGES